MKRSWAAGIVFVIALALAPIKMRSAEEWKWTLRALPYRLRSEVSSLRNRFRTAEELANMEAEHKRLHAELDAYRDPWRAHRPAAQQLLLPLVVTGGGAEIECGGVPSMQGLRPREPFDYIAIRTYGQRVERVKPFLEPATPPADRRGFHWTSTEFATHLEQGMRCGIIRSDACLETLRHHPIVLIETNCGGEAGCGVTSVVTTRGSRVEHWRTQKELVELLAPIDSIDEAALLVVNRGFKPRCSYADRARLVPAGFIFKADFEMSDELPNPPVVDTIHVSTNGTLDVTESIEEW